MRKYFLSIVALAGMLFATSCQESLVEPQVAGPTTFTVQLPNQMGTKAFGDVTSTNATIDSLFVEVYSADGNTLIYEPAKAIKVEEGKATFTANLIQDQKYDIIFWAQKGNAYNTSDLRSIPMNNRAHNVDDGAAFFAFLNDFVPTGASQPVVLRRPFAQLNLGTTAASLVTNAGTVKLSQSSIQVEKVAATFNTVLGVGEGEQTVQFAIANVPTIKLKVGNVEYDYVSMDYLPIAGDDQALVNVNAQIKLDNGQVIDHTFTSVPVRENYRTNIVGNLISSTTDFNITIEEGFVEDESATDDIVSNEYLVVDNVADAKDAFDNGKTHVAINNIGNNQTLQLPDNGKELYLQLPDSDGQITINRDAGNFNISVPNTNPSNTGLTIIIVAPNSTVDFTGKAYVIYSTTASNTLNLNGAEVGTIIVNKGNVVIENQSQVEVLDNKSGVEVTVYVDSTSDVNVLQGDNFVEIEGPTEINSLAALQTVLNYSASDVIVVPNGIVNTSEFTLELNGKTVTAVDNSTGSYGLITNKANLTIVGPGTISLSATNNRAWNAYSSVISNSVGGNLTVGEGVVIEHLGGTDMAYGIDNLTNGKGTSAITTIDGATIKSTYRAIRQFLNGVEATNELYVKAGSTIEAPNKSVWMQDPSKNANTGKLVVEEGANLNNDVYLSVTAGSTEWPVEVSIAASALKNGSEVITGNVPVGYEVVEVGGVWKVIKSELWELVSTADELVAALESNKSVIFANDIEQADGVVITDKNITIDLNGKTYTVTEGASTNNRNFKINGSSEVTIKNGTMVAAGDYSSGAYGTLRTEGTANVTLYDVKLYNYRGNGLNVKALSGTTVTITNTEIYSVYGGGVEAAGGTVELTNVKVEQKGMYTAPYNSMAISVNGGGQVTVHSGTYSTECITAEEANNQGSSHGPWCAGVLNSGGTLIIKGGTFSNDNFGENSLATYARGLLLADTGANIQIEGGTFNAVKAIIDIQNNLGDASKQPNALLKGGDYSANPTKATLSYGDDYIHVAEGYVVNLNANGTYTVIPTTLKDGAVLDLGGVEYNGTITVEGNVTIKGDTKIKTLKSTTGCTITIEEGKTLTLNNFSFGSAETAGKEYEIKGGTVVANYGFFQHGTYALRSNFETGYMYYSFGSDITVYGILHSQGKGDGLDYVRGKLTIAKGGKSIHDKSLWVGQPASWGAMSASLIIEEGGYLQANSLSVYEGSSLTYYKDENLKYNTVTGAEYITKK